MSGLPSLESLLVLTVVWVVVGAVVVGIVVGTTVVWVVVGAVVVGIVVGTTVVWVVVGAVVVGIVVGTTVVWVVVGAAVVGIVVGTTVVWVVVGAVVVGIVVGTTVVWVVVGAVVVVKTGGEFWVATACWAIATEVSFTITSDPSAADTQRKRTNTIAMIQYPCLRILVRIGYTPNTPFCIIGFILHKCLCHFHS